MISCSTSRLDQQHSIPWLLCHWNCCMYTEKPAMFQQIEPADCEKSQEIAGLNSVSVPVIFDRDEPMTTTVQPGERLTDRLRRVGWKEFPPWLPWFWNWRNGLHPKTTKNNSFGFADCLQCWLVVFFPPLWKIWVRHLGWWQQPNISKNKKWQPNHQPEWFTNPNGDPISHT